MKNTFLVKGNQTRSLLSSSNYPSYPYEGDIIILEYEHRTFEPESFCWSHFRKGFLGYQMAIRQSRISTKVLAKHFQKTKGKKQAFIGKLKLSAMVLLM